MASKQPRKLRYDRLAIMTAVLFVLIVLGAAALRAIFHSPDSSAKNSSVSVLSSSVRQESSSALITAGGDILLEEPILNYFAGGSWNNYMEQLWPYFQQDDLTIVNQEVPIGGEELGITGIDYSFNSPAMTASNLKAQGIDAVTLANNHAFDRGMQGIINTHENLRQAGIGMTGTAADPSQERSIYQTEINGIRIGVVSYTYATNQPAENSWAVNIFGSAYSDQSDALIEDIQKAKEQNDAVIACIHWGTEFTYELNEDQKILAQACADAGADVIIGNHPHCIQPAVWLSAADGRQVLCFYSLGNLIASAYQVDRADEQFQNMYEVGAIAQFELQKEADQIRIISPQIIPFVNQFEGNYSGYSLVLLKNYTEEMAAKHDQRSFSDLFTKEWIVSQVHQVFDPSGIPVLYE